MPWEAQGFSHPHPSAGMVRTMMDEHEANPTFAYKACLSLEGTDARDIKGAINAWCLTLFDTVELVLIFHWPLKLDSNLTEVKVFVSTSVGFE